MHSPPVNAAVITGHPPHGLRVFKFLEVYKPRMYVITDGSGSNGRGKITEATAFLEQCGATLSSVFCRLTDAEMYEVIKRRDSAVLVSLAEEIADDLERSEIDLVAGDAIEGFSPTHDLCRYLINASIAICERRTGRKIRNYDFLLDGPPNACDPATSSDAIWLTLDEEEAARKMAAVRKYPDISVDIETAMRLHGEESFRTECLRPVTDPFCLTVWNGDRPHYETYGEQKVRDGVYKELISFRDHLEPLGSALFDHAAR